MAGDLQLRVRLSADGQQLIGELKAAENSVQKFGSTVASGIVTAAKWATGIVAAGAAVTTYLVAANADAIRQIDQFADSLGMSTQTLTEWQYAAESVGVAGENMQSIFQDLQDKIGDFATTGGGEATDVFESLNIAVADLMNLSPAEQLTAIADAMQDVNQNQKVFFMESLASDSTRLLPLLENNAAALKKLQLEAQVLGRSISDVDAAKVTESALAIDRTQGLITGLANEITVSLAPMLTGVSNMLFESAVEAGGFGDAVNTAVEGAITGLGFVLDVGQQLLIWSKYAQVGLTTVGQAGTGAMAAFSDTTASVINTVLRPFQDYYTWLIDKFSSLVGLAAKIGGPFAAEFKEASDWLAGLSKDTDTFLVDGSDIIALNESMKSSIATTSQELEDLLNADAPSDTLKNWIEEARKSSDDAAESSVRLRNESKSTGVVVSNNAEAAAAAQKTYAAALSESTSNSVQSLADLEEQSQRVWSAFDAGKINAEQAADAIDGIAAAGEASAKSLADFASDALDSIDPLREIERTMEQVWAAFDAGHLDAGQVSQYVDGLNKDLDNVESTASKAAERIDAAFASAWNNLDEGFSGLAKGLKSAFTSMLAEMAHEALTKPIMLNIQSSLGGVGGAASPVSGAIAAAALVTVAAISAANKKDDERMHKFTAEYRQGVQSTGTILGDINAKSHSLANLTETLVEMSEGALDVNNKMLRSLQSIEVGIKGVAQGMAKQLSGVGGLESFESTASGSNAVDALLGSSGIKMATDLVTKPLAAVGLGFLDDLVGGVLGGISKAVYSKKKTLQDAGISFAGQSLGEIIDAGFVDADSYQQIKTTRKTLGVSSSSSKTETSDLDDAIQYQLGSIFSNAAGVLGDIGSELDLSLQHGIRGMKANLSLADIIARDTTEIVDYIDVSMDDFISSLAIDEGKLSLKGLKGDELSAEIESYISSNLDSWAESMLEAANMDGFVAQYQQAGEGVFETLGRLTAESRSFQSTAEQLNLQFGATGLNAAELTQKIASLAGGFGELQSQTAAYYRNYFSEAEQQAHLQQQLTAAFAEYNAELPKSKDEYRDLVESLDLTSDGGQQAYVRLMELQNAFSEFADAAEKAAEKAAAAERQALQDSLSLYLQNLANWSSEELSRIESDYRERISLAEQQLRIGRELRQYVEQLKISELSPYDPGEKLQLASESFAKLLVQAEAGDMDAAGQLQSAANAYLQNADGYYGRSDPYTSIFEDVTQSLDRLGLDIMGGLDEDSVEKLNRQMLAEQQRIRDYAQQQLSWVVAQYDALTSIEQLLELLPDSLASQLRSITNPGSTASATEALLLSQWEKMGGGAYAQTDLARYAAGIDSGTVDKSSINNDLAYYQKNQSATMQQVLDLWNSTGGGNYNDADLADYAAHIASGNATLSKEDLDYYRKTRINGSHKTGLQRVPFDGYVAELHKDERVLTAGEAQGYNQFNSDAIVAKLDQLCAENAALRSELAEVKRVIAGTASKAEIQRDRQLRAALKTPEVI